MIPKCIFLHITVPFLDFAFQALEGVLEEHS